MSNPSEAYENEMVPTLFGPAAKRLVEAARPQPGDRVLDVACGTGICYRTVAPHVEPDGTLAGIDVNPNMIAVARDVADGDGLTVDLHEGDAADLPFPDNSFDLVLCGVSWMWFEDSEGALAEMRRVLTSGGRVAISIWQALHDQNAFEPVYWQTVADHLGVDLQDLSIPFRGAVGDELLSLLIEAGFEEVEIVPSSFTTRYPNPDAWLEEGTRASVEVVPSFAEMDEPEQEELIEAIIEELGPNVEEFVEDDHVVLEYSIDIGRGNAPA